MYRTLISPSDLAELAASGGPLAVFDTRFSLADTERGRRDYLLAHIPDAIYAHLDEDMSGPVIPGQTGRHPLPEPAVFAERLAAWGVSRETQVVAYDDSDGGVASRLWWMLRWLGHDATAVLDGGWRAWTAAGLPRTAAVTQRVRAEFTPRIRPGLIASLLDIMTMRMAEREQVLDARTADRYAGLNETIDPVAGHIPGAANLPYPDTTAADGRGLPPAALKDLIRRRLPHLQPERAIVYCGSGVTACRTILALEHAGLTGARLYPGSWSEWIAQTDEVATGPPSQSDL